MTQYFLFNSKEAAQLAMQTLPGNVSNEPVKVTVKGTIYGTNERWVVEAAPGDGGLTAAELQERMLV